MTESSCSPTRLTAELVAAYVSNNMVTVADLPAVIATVHAGVKAAIQPPAVVAEPEAPAPAVPIRKSVHPDYIVCLEDGKKLKMLKRHLMTRYGLTPDDYRTRWGLPRDYPMVAPNYAKSRADTARRLGLGRRRADDDATA